LLASEPPPRSLLPPEETTTLWDFPRQGVDGMRIGDPTYPGVTPALAAVNVIRRFSEKGDLVVDPMCGSGTTIDAARILGRRALGFDLAPRRPDILPADARALPLPAACARLAFVDPPYSDNLRYSDDPRCLGRLPAPEPAYYDAVEAVAKEVRRILRPDGVIAWVTSDEYRRHRFTPVGFRTYERLLRHFAPVDIVCLARRGDRSATPMWEHRARTRGFYLRGFKYLFLMRREASA
jgi:SAM-dependent methyltransferase